MWSIELETKITSKRGGSFRGICARPGKYVRALFQLCFADVNQAMEDLLRQAFRVTPRLVEMIDNGKFSLQWADRSIVLPQVWESLAAPGWTFVIRFLDDSIKSSDLLGYNVSDKAIKDTKGPKPEQSEEEEVQKPTYDAKIRYTVETYQKSIYNSNLSFLGEKNYDEAVIFSGSGRDKKTLPVLQETVKLVRSSPSSDSPPFPGRRDTPTVTSARKETLMPGDKIGEKFLKIHSPLLLNALRTVIKYSSQPPSGEADPLNDGIFPYPYKDLFLHKDDLVTYKNEPNATKERHSDDYNAECARHIDVLVDYLYSQDAIRLKQAEEGRKKDVPVTTFGSLWLLLKSGTDVYVKENGILNAYIVDSVFGGVNSVVRGLKEDDKVVDYSIRLWNIAFDGDWLERRSHHVRVPVFDGERDVTSLPLFPAQMHRDEAGQQTRREQLVERGMKYVQLIKGPSFREYSGKGLDLDRTVCYQSPPCDNPVV
jgi:hypothetical protein